MRSHSGETDPPAMGHDTHRVHSVIAALKRVREHVARNEDTDEWDPEPYNRWVGMLEDVLSPDEAQRILIGDEWLTNCEYLMNLDACIAFLESEHPVTTNAVGQVIDADFSEPAKPRPSIWPARLSKIK
jgi:hypothetical protein